MENGTDPPGKPAVEFDKIIATTPSTNPQSPRSVSSTANKERWEKLQNLNDLYDQGFITLAEYQERKAQLIDQLTGTRGGTAAAGKSPRGKSSNVPQKVPYKARFSFCILSNARNTYSIP